MAFESTTIQQINQHILELSALITQQSDAFKPLLQPLSVSGTPEASAVLSLQSFSMGLASHVLDLEKALIQWMADESTLRALDAKDGQ